MSFDSIEIEGIALSCVRGGRTVLDGVSFACGPRRPLVVRGPNGAGKSTLLRLLAGFIRPASGRLIWRQDGAARSWIEPESVLFLGHQEGLKPALSVAQNLRFWAAYYGASPSLDAALSSFGLEALAGIPVQYLSAGQRKRAALSRLCVGLRPVWLIDEPTTALDDEGKAIVLDMLRAHAARGGVAVVATHDSMALEGADELRLGGGNGPEPL